MKTPAADSYRALLEAYIDARLLAQVHERLSYPWLSPVALRDELDSLRRATPAFAFVAPFIEPAAPLVSLTSPR